MSNNVIEMIQMTNLVIMTEAMKRRFVFTPEEMNAIRDLENTCHRIVQCDDLKNTNELLELLLKAMTTTDREP